MTDLIGDGLSLAAAIWPVMVIDENGQIRQANPAAKTFFGAKLDGPTPSLAPMWTNENDGAPNSFLDKVRAAKGFQGTLKLRARGMAITAFTASVCPLNDAFLVQLHPPAPSAGKAQSVEINVAQKQKLDCALQLTRTVALDFNNSLTAILGHATFLLGRLEPENPCRASLTEIEKASERAAEIANQLAAFSSETKDAMAQTTGNINALLRRTVELFQTPQNAGLAWSLQLDPKIFSVNHDEAKMQQAFVKILENAVQALPPDGRITVQTRSLDLTAPTQDRTAHLQPGAYVCVEIADTGCGIEPAVLPRVFEPFFTTKYGHRGLGLAWVYGIVTNHGGGVAISSQLGAGTSVRVYLPALRKVVDEKVINETELDGRELILVVDDEEMVLTMADTVLRSRGYRVLTAISGAAALEVIANTKAQIDLMITDMVMPQMNGRELIEQVRHFSPATAIVCATACTRSQSMAAQYNFLSKPFTAQQLLRKVRESLAPQPA